MAVKNKHGYSYEEALVLYEKLVKTNPEIERKGATLPYTSHNGHMFSILYKDGNVGLRLSEKDREVFMKKYKAKHPEQYGTVLKEYVLVPAPLLKKTKELKKYFDLSFDFVRTLKPKKK
ncbi:MAG TPA: hypothetical protein VNZ49_01775 [Bacteroidia bacterium]|jgi:hypothetical protein|nr:hypothetical protein [Bacteroidia bacterium]